METWIQDIQITLVIAPATQKTFVYQIIEISKTTPEQAAMSPYQPGGEKQYG